MLAVTIHFFHDDSLVQTLELELDELESTEKGQSRSCAVRRTNAA
jgi:hypothetical protein